jgi:hypothetical protein
MTATPGVITLMTPEEEVIAVDTCLDSRYEALLCPPPWFALAMAPSDAWALDPSKSVQETLGGFPSLEPTLVLALLACVPSYCSVTVPRPAFGDHDLVEVLKRFPPCSLAALPPAVFEAVTCLGFFESAAYLVNATAGVIVPQLRLLARLGPPPQGSPKVSDRHAVLLAYGGGSPRYEFRTLACTDSFCETIVDTARQVNTPCLVMPRSPLANADFVAWVDRTHPGFVHEHDRWLLTARQILRRDALREAAAMDSWPEATGIRHDTQAKVITLLRTDALTARERSVLLDELARRKLLEWWERDLSPAAWPSGAESWSVPSVGSRSIALEPTIMARFERRPAGLPQLIQWLERNGLTFDPKVLPESLKMRAVTRCLSPRHVPERDGWLQQWLNKEAGGGHGL